jgi:hypothetical protein
MKPKTRKPRQPVKYVARLIDHDGSPVLPGSPT